MMEIFRKKNLQKSIIPIWPMDLVIWLPDIAKLCELISYQQIETKDALHIFDDSEYKKALDDFRFPDACNFIWEKITATDKYIDETKPWELIKKDDPRLRSVISHLVDQIRGNCELLKPLLPQTAEKIKHNSTDRDQSSQTPFPKN